MEIVNKIDRFRIQDWLLKCDEQNTQDCFPKFASGTVFDFSYFLEFGNAEARTTTISWIFPSLNIS